MNFFNDPPKGHPFFCNVCGKILTYVKKSYPRQLQYYHERLLCSETCCKFNDEDTYEEYIDKLTKLAGPLNE